MKSRKWLREKLRDISYELEAPITKKGSKCSTKEGDVTFGKELSLDEKEKYGYAETVVILGSNPQNKLDHEKGRRGEAIWEFDISPLPKKEEIVSANLRIVTFRTHGGLHIPFKQFAITDEWEIDTTQTKRSFL